MHILVTGIGITSGIGRDVNENIDALYAQRSGMGKTTLFPTEIDVPVAEVKLGNEELKSILGLPSDKTFSRTALLGLKAAKEAFDDANVDVKTQRVGLISSTTVGGMDLSENFYALFRNDPSKGRLRQIVSHDCGDSTERIARYIGIDHYVTTISTACSSAANAIMLGARMIKNDLLDAALVGGTDALCKFTLNGFNSLMILDDAHCRPFDKHRKGLNLGEGSAFIVLQRDDRVEKNAYCELTSFANANDANHQTATSPEGDGPYLAMSRTLEKAGMKPCDIDHINVHGTATVNNDLSEGRAIRRLFGAKVPPFTSTKGYTGHTLGAAGGVEAVYSVISIVQDVIFPTLNFATPIPDLDLRPATALREKAGIKHLLSNSFGFGGNASVLLFSAL
jgi:3-oxoacyl-[acyl-carrier-protein] synthase-1